MHFFRLSKAFPTGFDGLRQQKFLRVRRFVRRASRLVEHETLVTERADEFHTLTVAVPEQFFARGHAIGKEFEDPVRLDGNGRPDLLSVHFEGHPKFRRGKECALGVQRCST